MQQGQVVALYNYMLQIIVELIKLASLIITLNKSVACAERVSGVLAVPTTMNYPAKGGAAKKVTGDAAVTFKNVSFTYAGAGAESLSDISFTAKRGQTIGIIGGTGSGKTTVVRKIIESLPPGSVAVIPQDSYYNDQSSIPLEIRKQTNFDHPDAFDWPLFEQQIADLRQGHPIEQPTYSYLVCTRLPETVRVEPKEVIIVEGIMSLYDKELRDLMDLKIFVDAEPDERLLRVITRDMVERGHPLEMLIDKYRNILKPMHDEFIEPTKQYADIIIPNGGNNQKAIEILKLYIEKILGR